MSAVIKKLNELADIIKNMSDEELSKHMDEHKFENPGQYAELERIILQESDKIDIEIEEALFQASKKFGW